MLVTIKTEKIRETFRVTAEWEHPQDGIRPAKSCKLYSTFHTADEIEAWWKGISDTLEATHCDTVRVTVDPKG